MKPFLFLIALLYCINCYSQTLELRISTPQPRLGEHFTVSFYADTLSKEIFKVDTTRLKIYNYSSYSTVPELVVTLTAIKKGENEVGPFSFSLNGKNYLTQKVKFTVADSLPKVNVGFWIRKVPVNDTTVYIIIDQKQRAHNVITRKDDNSISTTGETDTKDTDASLNDDIDNGRVDSSNSSSTTLPDFIHNEDGCTVFYKCYKIIILDKKKPLILTRKAFTNLPDYYQFKDIVIN